jgi:Family of unknown function (DUF6328)
MAQLKDKIQNALDEGRMLVLGSQILVGFEYRSAFEPGFTRLPEHAQYLKMISLGVMLIATMLIMWPSAFHQIVEGGEDSPRLHRFTTRVLSCALLPFALGLGMDVFVAMEKLYGHTPGVLAALGMFALALFFWYGLELWQRGEHAHEIKKEQAMSQRDQQQNKETKTKDKIKHVLTEARTVLPGAQALLGFAFISMFADAFEKLPASSKVVHIISLALVALSTILLMTPAAYHRIVEQGEETEHFHRFASRVLLAAMIPLALGITADFYIVLRKVTNSNALSIVVSALLLIAFYGLWFGYTLYRRAHHTHAVAQSSSVAAD